MSKVPTKSISLKSAEHQIMCRDMIQTSERFKERSLTISFSQIILRAAEYGWEKLKEELDELADKLPR